MGARAWLVVALAALAASAASPADQFRFEHALYNVSIPENSAPRTRAAPPPGAPPPGVRLPARAARVRFRIRHGDRDKLFKAEERTVGDFCFLTVRTRSNHAGALNRERRDLYRLEVRATATLPDGTPLEADAAVLVAVSDENDLSPLFYPTEYEATVAEDAPPHASLLRVHADDADLGPNGEIYYTLLEPGGANQFDVHPTSGVLTATRPLRAAERAAHELVVLARDRASLLALGPEAPAARARVLVRVAPANLHAPELRARRLPELVENATEERIYAIVTASDRDAGEHGRVASVEVVDGDPDGHFRVRPSAGGLPHEWDLVAHALLDREAAPRGYNLTLRAADAGTPPRSAYLALAVALADADDNAPVFARRVFEARVPETAPPGTPVLRLRAADRDVDARVYLEVVGGNEGGHFRLNADTGVLYTARALDAEAQALHTLTVSAVDGGAGGASARLQSSAKVRVLVEDANDNDPAFPSAAMEVVVPEGAPAGAVVARVQARDADAGENAYVSYSLANVLPVPFEVDHFSGAVRATRVLDYEGMRREWALRVRASDWGQPLRRQAELALTVRVADVNDNRPQLERVECSGAVPRRTPKGARLHTLSAVDADAGDAVSYRLLGGNEDSCFALDAATGELTLACDLRATSGAGTRVLNVTATDGTHFADATTLTLHLVSGGGGGGGAGDEVPALECRETGAARRLAELLAEGERANHAPAAADADADATEELRAAADEARRGRNAHAPEFVDFPVEVRVNESVALGATLVRLRARDRDPGYGGLVVFALSGGDPHSAFRVEPSTGALQVIARLDREREHEYYLNVSAYDLGRPQRSASRLLPVTVLDANDNAPRFERALAAVRVPEDAPNGTVVFRARATDADAGEFARVAYSLRGADGEFCVGRASGVLAVCGALDRERRALFELAVRATDGGGRWAEARVRVTVDDVNDNAPRFAQAAYGARVREDAPPGTLVALLAAADPDAGAGGRLRYGLAARAEGDDGDDGDDGATFTVDALSGAVRTARWLDWEARQAYAVAVRCWDGGQPPLWSDAALVVEVLDVDENRQAPAFADALVLEARVREDAPVGTRVLRAKATDADPPGRDSRLSYYIVGGGGMAHFTIDDTGVIRTATPLDREAAPHYWLTVAAEDHGLVPKYTTVQVYIEVEDVNDVAPWPERALYEALVAEHAPKGTAVARVRCEDADAAPAPVPSNVTYAIAAGNPGGLFAVDARSGLVATTGRALDREAAAEHALEVRCDDGALGASARVHIAVQDVNDNAPAFVQRFYDIRVPTDPEVSSHAAHAAPDNALPQMDAAEAEADESSTESESENEAESDEGAWDALEDPRGMRYIATVLALDADAGANGTVRYSARARGAARGLVRVQAATGRLFASAAPQLERALPLDVTLRACDGGAPPRCGVARAGLRAAARGGGAAPRVQPVPPLQVAELDAPGFLLAVLQADDPDGDALYYEIAGGDDQRDFHVGRDDGSLVLARRPLWERRASYALNVSVSDGANAAHVVVDVAVINDVNEGGVRFSRAHYEAEVAAPARAGLELVALEAAGAEGARLLFGVQDARAPASLGLFRVHETDGTLLLARALGREHVGAHELTVWARDSAPRASRALCRVLVRVLGGDLSAPAWPRRLLEVRLPRSAPAGALVAALRAADADEGAAGAIEYSLPEGDAAGLFRIDPLLGDVRLTRALPQHPPREYTLRARAANPPPFSRSAMLPLHITIVEPDDAPPRFVQSEVVCSVAENEPAGTWLATLEARGVGVRYELRGGQGALVVDPAAGTLATAAPLDYERTSRIDVSVVALAMGGGTATATVVVHVLDRNEHAPRLVAREYRGAVSEAAAAGALVLAEGEPPRPLVLATEDADSPAHRQRAFEVLEAEAAALFAVDATTGALALRQPLDHEQSARHEFTVRVHDAGSPRLVAPVDSWARVVVLVQDVNDVAPRFAAPRLSASLLLPTLRGVLVLHAPAEDPDAPPGGGPLAYDIIEGDPSGVFRVSGNGSLVVERPDAVLERQELVLRASDGQLAGTTRVQVRAVRAPAAGLAFAPPDAGAAALENTTKPAVVAVLNVLGAALDEHLHFSILNPLPEFEVGPTSGVVRTTGVPLDREARDSYTLLVQARSLGGGGGGSGGEEESGRVAVVRLRVAVTDANDNCPVFVERPYVGAVAAGAPAGTRVLSVRAEDADLGDNGEVRYEMKRGHGELFRVDRRSGLVALRQPPPAPAPADGYTLTVAAFDGGVPACASEAQVVVRVWPGGDAPQWERPHYRLRAPEDTPPGAPLGEPLRAHSPPQRALLYSLVHDHDQEQEHDEHLFDVHFDTAGGTGTGPCVLVSLGALDFERRAEHALTVRATDPVSGLSADASVTLQLQDANDCAPQLDQDVYRARVSEAAPNGHLVLTAHAHDDDSGPNGEVQWSLAGVAGGENASASLALFAVQGGRVRVAAALDAEAAQHHHLLLVATDRGRPPLSTTAHLFITVEDVNDNPPELERASVAALVSWEAERGTAVARVAAWDPDDGDSGALRLALEGSEEERRAFAVDAASGLVTLQEPALWRAWALGGGQGPRPPVTLRVSASDGAHAVLARVQLRPAPANRHAPAFAHQVYEARAAEGAPPPLLLTTVRATDDDEGDFGAVAYSIPSARLRETFAVDAASGALTTRAPLDREARAEWLVPVAAHDGGGLRGHTAVRVRVLDADDNAPAFPLAEYRAAVRADRAPLVPFLTLEAHDADADADARLSYEVYEGDARSDARGLFHVDAHTGALSFARNATEFAGRALQVWVRARDGGGLAAEAPVGLRVLAAHERAPAVAPPPPDLFLQEDAAPGTLIAELRAPQGAPEAQAPGGEVRYRLAPALWPRGLFAVDAAGRLTLEGRLDRETQAQHLIGIVAEADGAAVLLTTRLHVLDVNDHAPAFHSQPYVLHVAENTPVDTSLVQLMADDPDAGSNGEVRYSLGADDSDAGSLFAVDAASGWVVLRAPLDREARAEHRLSVLATDGGAPPRATRGTLVLRLVDHNDCPPVFARAAHAAAVAEDAPPGALVAQLAVEDADAVAAPLAFLLAGGDPRGRFQLRAGGQLLVARALDRERVPAYSLLVAATDGKFTAYTTVNVTVTDVNDNPPYCVHPRYEARLSEAAPPGTVVATILTADADDAAEPPAFSLSGDHHDHFTIDKDTGVVTVAASGALDREAHAQYELVATAADRDRARPAWRCSARLAVRLQDENDNAPRFTSAAYAATLPEDAPPGSVVAKVHAVDADLGENRRVRYSWADGGPTDSDSGHGGLFALAADTGVITLRAALDRETQAEHRLAVVAADGGSPPRSAVAEVRLSVSDVNDNPPEFEWREYHAALGELAPVGTRVLRVHATSRDAGANAEVRYALVAGDGREDFQVDAATGELSVARALDFERRREYLLSVQAVDGGVPPLSDVATVNVSVSDANDNAPAFAQPQYEVRVREDAPAGTRVLELQAWDADAGENGRVEYSLARGDPGGLFALDAATGRLALAAPLDREARAEHALEVRARDRGLPALEASAAVRVLVLDANDNAPRFEPSANHSCVVREDWPLGHALLALRVSDADAPPNGAPFTFDVQAGNEAGAFRVEADGTVRTAARFSRRIRERYALRVRVFDNGTPPLFADAWVHVQVVEESQYPPVATPLEVLVNSYRDEFPGGALGRVFASDRDPYDALTFALADDGGDDNRGLFSVDAATGTLSAAPRLDAGEYRLRVAVSDGKFVGSAPVRVLVVAVSDEMLAHAAVVRFRAVAASAFVLSHRKGFVRAVAEAAGRAPADVALLSVQQSGDDDDGDDGGTEVLELRRRRQVARDLDVAFAVRGADGWLAAEELRRRLHAHVERLEERARLVLEELVRAACPGGCGDGGGGACRERVRLVGAPRAVASDVFALVAPRHRLLAECRCPPGRAGPRCEREPTDDDADADMVVSFNGDGYLQYRVERGVVAGARLLDDELVVSLRFRTRRARGVLLSAAGRVDHATLELARGRLRFAMELGAGEVVLHVGEALDDGAWHDARLERRGGAVRLAVDRRSAAASAPPPNAVLDARADRLLVGARLQAHAHALAPEQVTHGFEGCIAELRLGGARLPLQEGASAAGEGRAQLVRAVRASVGEQCAPLGVPGACGGHPCAHGGTCREDAAAAAGFACQCHAPRFSGARCEVDAQPCAARPCLHGGTCLPDAAAAEGYRCRCAPGLSGARCQRGRWCPAGQPVCQHGGACEEGEWGPSCVCRGYWGARCQFDVDECAGEPCASGAACRNEPGSFRCECPAGRTGDTCGDPLLSHAVTLGGGAGAGAQLAAAWRWALAERWPLAAAAGAVLALLLAVVLPLALRARRRPRAAAPAEAAPLNSRRPPAAKAPPKLSNLARDRPPSGAGAADPPPLNNMDTLRSYGSAGDELEALPPHYIRNLNLDPPDRKPWSEQMHLHTFADNKIYNDLKGCKAGGRAARGPTSPAVGRRVAVAAGGGLEGHLVGGYHWDCSDWCAGAPPGISEVAGSERRDSSSPPLHHHHQRQQHQQQPALPPPPPAFATLPLGSDSAADDTEHDTFKDAAAYLLHPDRYLPCAGSESDGDPRPQPQPQPEPEPEEGLRARNVREPDAASLITMLEERHSLLGGGGGGGGLDKGGSCSDVSATLCEIEDSDDDCDDHHDRDERASPSAPRHTAV